MLKKFETKFNIFKWYDKIKDSGKKVAWMSAFAPAEIFLAFDIIPVYPENHAAMLGALTEKDGTTPMSEKAISEAKEKGYSWTNEGSFRGLCSYAVADIGSAMIDNSSPIKGLPAADILYSCNSQCTIVDKWAKHHQKIYSSEGREVPVFILDTPHLRNKEVHTPEEKKYWLDQFKSHIKSFGEITGIPFDKDKLTHIMDISDRSSALWVDCLNLCKNDPAPFSSFDAFGLMAPIVVARGSEECLNYYTDLKKEISQRVNEKYSVVGNEKKRLIWDAIPIWPKKNYLNKLFANFNSAFVASTYTNCWDFQFTEKDIFESFYRVYGHNYTNHSAQWQFDFTKKLFDEFQADGLVMHWNVSCGIWNSSIKKREKLLTEAKIPYTIIRADMTDASEFDEKIILPQLENFLATLQ